ncbi:glycerophosphoryl diester phosphodiesterase [Algoriphagus ratkowskyi]|uniref:Glycerophosphodiester phosphodiesterase family protein n=1 Tax=Algoriphagus ratkowskyi TaxID=57028 RepID=A0A2W7RSW2_9BACT|nr:glycerophosphodiester phosphodiesterase family protein [Algoriphagus ratkowskyi]PZX53945.1 glycerophosphoryl diester phosphodiesterase [Algoriphagus ratkowskyi]TXD76655.1 glycerophosphodiester phosphodiesterase family protein [Algoriphagus ratkowskyi]
MKNQPLFLTSFSKRVVVFALTFFFYLSSFAQVDQIREKLLNSNELLVAAHRAAHQHYPENSLEAIQEAIDLGVDIIEIDVRVTTDGKVYLMHDQTIDRTTTGNGDIEKMSSADLKQYTLLFDGKDSGIAIPTLNEALALSKGKIMVDLDLKTSKIDEVMAVVQELNVLDEVIFFDSDWEILKAIKAKMPSAYLMPRTYKTKQIKKAYKQLDPVIVHIDPSFNSKKTYALAKKFGVRTWINSLGDLDRELSKNPKPELAFDLLQHGASVVQTDLPKFWIGIKAHSPNLQIAK